MINGNGTFSHFFRPNGIRPNGIRQSGKTPLIHPLIALVNVPYWAKLLDMIQSRVRISWNSTEVSSQCCLCSLSSAPLPGVQMVRVSDLYLVGLGFKSQLDPRIFPMDLFLSLSEKKYKNISFLFLVRRPGCKMVTYIEWVVESLLKGSSQYNLPKHSGVHLADISQASAK